MKTKQEIKYVLMSDVIGSLAEEYAIPILSFDNLVLLGQRTVHIYNLDHRAKTIKFAVLCEYITMFIQTPFGKRLLKELS